MGLLEIRLEQNDALIGCNSCRKLTAADKKFSQAGGLMQPDGTQTLTLAFRPYIAIIP
ncbi:hypothetical protein D3C75_1340160 [compost metagenome]